jgi:hypothetical protein
LFFVFGNQVAINNFSIKLKAGDKMQMDACMVKLGITFIVALPAVWGLSPYFSHHCFSSVETTPSFWSLPTMLIIIPRSQS